MFSTLSSHHGSVLVCWRFFFFFSRLELIRMETSDGTLHYSILVLFIHVRISCLFHGYGCIL